MMNCKEASRLLSEKQDRVLSRKEHTALKFHTLMCSACRNFDKQMAALSTFSQSYIKVSKKDKDARKEN
ncbi:MAG: zf-HC2 domain-containing protein [Oleiphilus sp.]